LGCDCSVYTDVACADTDIAVREGEVLPGRLARDAIKAYKESETYRGTINHAYHQSQNSGRDDNSPERKAQFFLAGSWGIEVAQCCHPKYQHCNCECEEAGIFAERWPVTVKVAAEERQL
jgi:hypothetical protein